MSNADPHDETSTQPPSPTDEAPKRRRNPWVWVSGLLAVIAAGLLIWALTVASDRDSTQDELESTQQELTSSKQQLDETEQDLEQQQTSDATADESGSDGGALVAAGGLAAAKRVYDDLTEQLGATEDELAATEQDLKDANADAKQAAQDADAAEKDAAQAGNETDKAKAEADKAKADAKAAESKATVVADCAKAYFSAFGMLFEGDDVQAQAAQVREQLKGITSDCETALGET
jgi:septal ring factor EnvC (AmiA/AmiB activator)